jgi:hypothetical protein
MAYGEGAGGGAGMGPIGKVWRTLLTLSSTITL